VNVLRSAVVAQAVLRCKWSWTTTRSGGVMRCSQAIVVR
jgi:hypothetical protein